MTEAQRTRLLVALEQVHEVMRSVEVLNQRQRGQLETAERALQCALVRLETPRG